jgi:sirohydrochlorin cobaltochelatase
MGDYSDAALILIGHGSTQDAGSSAPVLLHAATLRGRGCFAEVREAFWKQEPRLEGVLESVVARRVFLVPMFISEGYFSEQVIPRALGLRENAEATYSRVGQRGDQTLVYCRPLGTHASMTGVLLARAREVLERFPLPRAPQMKELTLFIAGHGTKRDEHSRLPIEQQVTVIRRLGCFSDVQAVYLEETPRIDQWYELARTKCIVVVPFFISDGLHVRQDIPVLLGAPARLVQQRLDNDQPGWRNPTEMKGKLVWYASSIGGEPLVEEVILERVREASQWRVAQGPTA